LNKSHNSHLKLNDRWYLVPEFKPLSLKGARDVTNPLELTNEFDVSKTSSKIILNYIDVPILLQYRLQNGLYFSSGPQFSFLTSAQQRTRVTLTSGTIVTVVDGVKDRFKTFIWSFPVEVGFAFKDKRGGKGMDFRARYSYGFNEVFENGAGVSANHSTFQFIVAFPFVETKKDSDE